MWPAAQIQIRTDPLNQDVDSEIDKLRSKVSMLKEVTYEIESETKLQNSLIMNLEQTMAQARDLVRATMKRVDKAYKDGRGPGHIMILLGFSIGFFLFLWVLSKFV